jgi:hypothetical protein
MSRADSERRVGSRLSMRRRSRLRRRFRLRDIAGLQ